MTRNVFAVVFGIVLAVLLIMVVETIGHNIYPPPTHIDFTDMEEMTAYLDELPTGALLFVMAAWLTGTIGGGLLACFIARDRPLAFASMVGGIVLFATVYTLVQIPHPMWFSITSVIAICVVSYLTGRLGALFIRT
jgi:hypothetical protein